MQQQTRATGGAHAEDTSHTEGRLVSERSGSEEQSGTSGVSDKRRAELEQLEIDAGTEHEAPDETVPQRSQTGLDASGPPQGAAAGSAGAVNPDIDKR